MAGERRPRAWRLLFLSVLVLVLAWPVVAPASLAQQEKQGPPRGRDYVEMVTRRMQQDREAPRYPATRGRIPCVNGFAGPYPCKLFDLMSHVTLAEMGGTRGNDIWGWKDPVTGEEWALMGLNTGTSFVNVTDPENPVIIGRLPTHTFNSTWRDIKVFNNHAFVVSEASGHGMQVFDLTHLRTAPPGTIFPEDAHYAGFGNAHNIFINEETGFAYPIGSNSCSGGPHVVNVNDPLNPQFAGCVSGDGYSHDTQCVIYRGPDAQHQGKEICFSSNEDTLTIVDVTNKATPVQLSRTPYPGSAYTHQGWLNGPQTEFALDDELDEQRFGHNTRTRVFNVSNLDAPFVKFVFNGTTTAIDHNQYWIGRKIYQSNYRAGLRLIEFRAGELILLRERAYFDVYPANDLAAFNGSWSNYAYFFGKTLVSSIEEGLFVVQFTGGP